MSSVVYDKLLGSFFLILVYWLYSELCTLLDMFESHSLHLKKDEDMTNLVSKGIVIKRVILEQTIQIVIANLLFTIHIMNILCKLTLK